MKKSQVDLHIERKRALITMLSFALLFSLIGLSATAILKTNCSWLTSLLRSKYIYSATVVESVSQDDYYQFNAGISFMLFQDAQTSINADILMQPQDSKYTKALDWNAEPLDTYSIAITAGLAKTNKLNIGDTIYSKHVVDGSIREYTIETILPEVSRSTATKSGISTDGVILMGFDKEYVENITHTSLVFTDISVDELTTKNSGTPSNILYRTDEVFLLVKRILPYCLLFMLLAILVSVALVFYLARSVRSNFKRLMTIGYEKRKLNSAYNKLVFGTSFGAVFIAFIVVLVISQLYVFSSVEAFVICILMITEIVTLLVSSWLSKRRLWR